jgi:hypothetical protein
MLTLRTKAQILRDLRLALAIHALFVLVIVVYATSPPDSLIFFVSSAVFLPQWITFYATSAFESAQPLLLLIFRCALGVGLSFVFSLLYAAAWRSALYFGRLVISWRRAKATRSV